MKPDVPNFFLKPFNSRILYEISTKEYYVRTLKNSDNET